MTDLKRNLFEKIDELLSYSPVVILLGVRQSGKTTLAKMVRSNWEYFDLERRVDFEHITSDVDFFFKHHSDSVIIDEAQRYPELFSELRGIVDRDRSKTNRFLLTGSSSPELLRGVSESLAGRVGIVELGTFKANEVYSQNLPSFYSIFTEEISPSTIDQVLKMEPPLTHDQLMDLFLRGGYPEPVLRRDQRFFEFWMENYLQTYIERDIRRLFPKLNLINYQRFVSMLTALSGTVINRSQVGRSLNTSEVSIRDYLAIAEGSFIWRNIPSYEKSRSKSLVKMPKGSFRDSGLAHTIQGVDSLDRLNIYPNLGLSFESFITEELIKGLQATHASRVAYYYYRTRNGAEIDLILEGSFGTLPIEIKYGSSINRRKLQTLKRFVKDHDLPLGILINNSETTELIADRIVQIPATML